MRKFSSRHRNTLQQKVRRLREGSLGDLRLLRYELPAEVGPFLDHAVAISRKTYQWQLHQRGLSATDLLRKRLEFAAAHGWMRCYLLFLGESAIAFIVGYQYEGTFRLDEIGHAPEFSKYSAGAVLQLLSVEDLFNHNRARMFDLQDYARYKDELSNENYLQCRVFLFRRGIYPRFLRAGHRICSAITLLASLSLEGLGLKSKVRRMIRRLGGSIIRV
jgi:CelD/BcsL family acetyltransferase involved in cellulose biosynthesis